MKRGQLAAIGFICVATTARLPSQESHAHATEHLGTVHFATSCAPTVAARFDRAVSLLHSFEFGAAIRGFNDVLSGDSTCAMAYWGIALSRWSNPMDAGTRAPPQLEPGRQAAIAGARIAMNATDRERSYLTAVRALYGDFEHVDQRARIVAYERAMATLVAGQPADTEAKIFYAIALTASAPPSDKTYANQLQAGAILEPLWVVMPDHPGLAHYIIHTYDVPPLASRAAAAAEKYSHIAPSAAHALHMPSHTFTRVGRWRESVETNGRSMAAAGAAGCIGEVLHAADYSVYAYLQLGQDSATRAIVDRLPRWAESFDVNAICGAAPGSAGVFALAAIPARYALERRDWQAVSALVPPPNASRFPWTAAMVYFGRALGASRTGAPDRAQVSIDSLSSIRDRLAAGGEGYWSLQVDIQLLAARAWQSLAQHHEADALATMSRAAASEDSTEKTAVTPGRLAPARELLGDMLLELNRPEEALAEYKRTLAKEPNRFRSLYGAWLSARRAGLRDDEASLAVQLKKLTATADSPGRTEIRELRSAH